MSVVTDSLEVVTSAGVHEHSLGVVAEVGFHKHSLGVVAEVGVHEHHKLAAAVVQSRGVRGAQAQLGGTAHQAHRGVAVHGLRDVAHMSFRVLGFQGFVTHV